MANILKLLGSEEVLTVAGSTIGNATAVRVYNKTTAAAQITQTSQPDLYRAAASTHTIRSSNPAEGEDEAALASTNVFTLNTMVGVEIGDVVTSNAAITGNPTVVGISADGTKIILSDSFTPIGGSSITLQQPAGTVVTRTITVPGKGEVIIQKMGNDKISGAATTFDAVGVGLYR